MSIMKGINAYFRQLSTKEIKEKVHREFVGGMWEELGKLQLDFLIRAGLKPAHKLLDVGCGSLRGGLHYLNYLDKGNYYGLDINKSLIEAGKIELAESGLIKKDPVLVVDDQFSFEKFDTKFDFLVSVSVFTHLPINIIIRCLSKARDSLVPKGIYYATFFQAPKSAFLGTIVQEPGGIVTNYDKDPFHYSVEELKWMAKLSGMECNVIGEWGHPRNQKMAAFSVAS